MTSSNAAIAVFALLSLGSTALGHQPIVSDGTANDAESSIPLGDVDISRVVYHEVTTDSPRLWLTFEGASNQNLYVQLGLPFIDRLVSHRPSIAVLGPGLPAIDLPFDVPTGLGGILISSESVTEPEVFDEPFSGTRSWILFEHDVLLPEAGIYYVVAFDPTDQPGKLWVATGREEVFEPDDIAELQEILPLVRAFHESTIGPPCFLLPVAGIASVFLYMRLHSNRRKG